MAALLGAVIGAGGAILAAYFSGAYSFEASAYGPVESLWLNGRGVAVLLDHTFSTEAFLIARGYGIPLPRSLSPVTPMNDVEECLSAVGLLPKECVMPAAGPRSRPAVIPLDEPSRRLLGSLMTPERFDAFVDALDQFNSIGRSALTTMSGSRGGCSLPTCWAPAASSAS